MDSLGVNVGLFVAQILSLVMLVVYVVLTFGTLLALRRYPLTASQQFMWVSLILFAPLLGAAAFWVIGPPTQTRTLQ